MQPPGFNLFLGAVLKVAPQRFGELFAVLFALAGLALALAVHGLLLRLGAPRAAALAGAGFVVLSPATLLYENWLFYELPVATALVLAAVALHRYLSGFAARDGALFFALVAAITLTRSLFHFVWCLGAGVAVVALAPPRERRRSACLALVALLPVGALYAKNRIVFGQFEGSSWLGMNLAKIALQTAPHGLREELVREGRLTPLALHRPFAGLRSYPEELRKAPTRPAAALARPEKAGGRVNFNHEAYVRISSAFAHDARAMIAAHPKLYLESVAQAFAIYAQPASLTRYVDGNRARIDAYEDGWNRFVLGAIGIWTALDGEIWIAGFPFILRDALYGWMALFTLATVVALVGGVRRLRQADSAPESAAVRAAIATELFLAANVAYISLVSNLLDLGENNRFRFLADPAAAVLVTLLLVAAARRFRGRRSNPAAAAP
jgi:hypothetical protein